VCTISGMLYTKSDDSAVMRFSPRNAAISLNHGCHLFQVYQLSCIRLCIGYLFRQVGLDIQRCSVVSMNTVGVAGKKAVNQSSDLSAPAIYI